MSEDTFWVYAKCACGVEMAMREAATWPICPDCGAPLRPPMPNMEGVTLRERGNGRKGLYSPIYEEQQALALARGWDLPDMDRIVPGFVEQQDGPPLRRVK